MRPTASLCIALLLAASLSIPPAQSQNPSALQFEVASIKPASESDAAKLSRDRGMRIDGARVDIGSASILQLMMTAYGVRSFQISGPDWIRSTRFDIEAKLPDGVAEDRVPEMMQAMLAERFKLVVHREARETSVYALLVGKDGAKLTPATPESATDAAQNGNTAARADREVKYTRSGETLHFKSARMTMPDLALQLTPYVDRPIVDMTKLEGAFAIELDLSIDDVVAAKKSIARSDGETAADAADAAGSSVFAALQKLGLKLERQKAPTDYIVIDHAEKIPTPN